MSKKIMISCDEATSICDKNQYGEASMWEKFLLKIHLLMCKHCRAYSSQNTLMTKLLGKHLHTHDHSHHLSVKDKEQLEKTLNEQLKK